MWILSKSPKIPRVIQRLVPPELKGTGDGTDRCLASMGIYVFSGASIMDALEGNTTDFGKEIIPSLVSSKIVRCHIFDDYWEDIGTVRAFFEANFAINQRNSRIRFL